MKLLILSVILPVFFLWIPERAKTDEESPHFNGQCDHEFCACACPLSYGTVQMCGGDWPFADSQDPDDYWRIGWIRYLDTSQFGDAILSFEGRIKKSAMENGEKPDSDLQIIAIENEVTDNSTSNNSYAILWTMWDGDNVILSYDEENPVPACPKEFPPPTLGTGFPTTEAPTPTDGPLGRREGGTILLASLLSVLLSFSTVW